MGKNKVVSGSPFAVNSRKDYGIMQVSLEITNIGLNGELLEFESEDPIILTSESPQRDVYYQSDKTGDDELVFFGVELKNEAIHLTPGNSKVDVLYMDFSAVSGKPIQHKRVAAAR